MSGLIECNFNLSHDFVAIANKANLFEECEIGKLIGVAVSQRIDAEMMSLITGRPPEYSELTKAVMETFNILEPSDGNESSDVFTISSIKSATGSYNCNRSAPVQCW